MADRNKSPKSQARPQYDNSIRFATLTLKKADQIAFEKWTEDNAGDLDRYLEQLCLESYRLGLKYDYSNHCFSCSLTQQDPKHVNNGVCLMTRGGSAVETLLMTVYKVYVLAAGGEWETEEKTNNWG